MRRVPKVEMSLATRLHSASPQTKRHTRLGRRFCVIWWCNPVQCRQTGTADARLPPRIYIILNPWLGIRSLFGTLYSTQRDILSTSTCGREMEDWYTSVNEVSALCVYLPVQYAKRRCTSSAEGRKLGRVDRTHVLSIPWEPVFHTWTTRQILLNNRTILSFLLTSAHQSKVTCSSVESGGRCFHSAGIV